MSATIAPVTHDAGVYCNTYLAAGAVMPQEFVGSGAVEIGVAGAVKNPFNVVDLADHTNPLTGEQMSKRLKGNPHKGGVLDQVLALSVALANQWASPEPDKRREMVECLNEGVAAVLDFYERVLHTRVGGAGLDKRFGGIIALKSIHAENRAGEFFPHVHLTIFPVTAVRDPATGWLLTGALYKPPLFDHSRVVHDIFEAAVIRAVQKRHPSLAFEPDAKNYGVVEVTADKSKPAEHAKTERGRQVDQEFEKIKAWYRETHGRELPPSLYPRMRRLATMRNRPPKVVTAVAEEGPAKEVKDREQKSAAEPKTDPEVENAKNRVAAAADQVVETTGAVSELLFVYRVARAATKTVNLLKYRGPSIRRVDLLAEVARLTKFSPGPLPPSDIVRIVELYCERNLVERRSGSGLFATPEQVKAETALKHVTARLSAKPSRAQVKSGTIGRGENLSPDQAAVARKIEQTLRTSRIVVVESPGLRADEQLIRATIRGLGQNGRRVVAAFPTATGAAMLNSSDAEMKRGTTLHRLCERLRRKPLFEVLRTTFRSINVSSGPYAALKYAEEVSRPKARLRRSDVVIVSDARGAYDPTLAALARKVEKAGATLVIFDTQGNNRGRLFGGMKEILETIHESKVATLGSARRPQSKQEARAVSLALAGRIDRAFDSFATAGKVHVGRDAFEVKDRLVSQMIKAGAGDRPASHLALTQDAWDAKDINRTMQLIRRRFGLVGKSQIGGLSKNDRVVLRFSATYRVRRPFLPPKEVRVYSGQAGVVEKVGLFKLKVRLDGGEVLWLRPHRTKRPIELYYATTIDRARDVTAKFVHVLVCGRAAAPDSFVTAIDAAKRRTTLYVDASDKRALGNLGMSSRRLAELVAREEAKREADRRQERGKAKARVLGAAEKERER
jgi:hypothetical protein